MTVPGWPADGGCRCGKVRFRLSAPPLIEMACHCRGCQHMSASAFSTTIIVAAPTFSLLQGDLDIGGIHGTDGRHHHCIWCKGWVYTEAAAVPQLVNVRATLLDDCTWFAPWAETQTAEKLPWAQTGAQRSFARFPAEHEYESLLAAYQAYRQWPAR